MLRTFGSLSHRPAAALWILLVLVAAGCGGGDGGNASTAPPVSATVQILYNFGGSSTDAMGPTETLVLGSDGNFYGTTQSGGIGGGGSGSNYSGYGAFFRISPTGEETVLYRFTGAPADGAGPQALIQGSDGNFYGTTAGGGEDDVGTVFKITPDGVETVVVSFSGANGPQVGAGGLIQGSDGNFYGTSVSGGEFGGGTFFRVTPAGVLTIIHSFGQGTDGSDPIGQLVQANDGNFYGVTLYGGQVACADGQTDVACGAVFRVTAEGVETILYSGPALDEPNGGLIQGSDGNLYGTIGSAVFRLTLQGAVSVYDIPTNGMTTGGLLQTNDGNFYGLTAGIGTDGGGALFQFVPAGVATVLYSFPSDADPDGSLVEGKDGNFYGTSYSGGAYDKGYFYRVVLH